MDIKEIKFMWSSHLWTIYKGELYHNPSGSNEINTLPYEVNDILKDSNLFESIKKSDLNKVSISTWIDDRTVIHTYKEVSIEYLKEELKNGNKTICFLKETTPQEITSFYKFEVWIETQGVRFIWGHFSQHDDYPDDIVISYLEPEQSHIQYTKITDPFEHRGSSYLVPMNKIDKIIGIKRYKDCNWIGTGYKHEKNFTGETEEFVLDLHNFNENIYQVFKDHYALDISFYE
jgi:hypothetical protein